MKCSWAIRSIHVGSGWLPKQARWANIACLGQLGLEMAQEKHCMEYRLKKFVIFGQCQ